MSDPAIDVSFRPAVLADALCVGMFGTQVFLDTYAPEGMRPELAREVFQNFSLPAIEAQLAMPSMSFILAESAGHLVGFAQLTHGARQELVTFPRTTELNRLYVHERFTAKGIGKALLGRAEQLAAAHGASAMWLSAWIGNQRAIDYYPRRGYSDVGAMIYTFEDDHYENRVFVKELAS